jgi:alpha-tubulin suppressor-like RCC1 family protein
MKIRGRTIATYILAINFLISGCKPQPIIPSMTATAGWEPLPIIPSITAGWEHNCLLTSGGAVQCWGDNRYGQLGDGTSTGRLTPVDVIGLTNGVSGIAAGGYHTCALTSGGKVKCWGDNHFGELGDGTTIDRPAPVDVIGLKSGVIAITAGEGQTCALTSSGGVKCWGDDQAGAVGDGTYTYTGRLTPVDVIGLTSGVSVVSASEGRTCALTSDGGAKCWGDGSFGELGNGSTDWSLTPKDVSGLKSGVSAITGGLFHTCALTSGGGVKCWGKNDFGQLGVNETDQTSQLDLNWLMSGVHLLPEDVIGLTSGVKAIDAGGIQTCALTLDGGVKCWGNHTSTPRDVWGLTGGVIAVAAGTSHVCALLSSGVIKCWGANYYGQIGDGTTTDRLRPVDVKGAVIAPQLSASPGAPNMETPTLPYIGVTTYLPTTELLSHLPDLFPRPSPYKGLITPGKNTYSLTVHSDRSYYLGFPWCAVSQEQLDSNLKLISYQLFIYDQQVPEGDILQYEGLVTNNGSTVYCHFWTTGLANWQKYETLMFDAVFTYSAPVFNGKTSYSPGKYEQQMVVDVQ